MHPTDRDEAVLSFIGRTTRRVSRRHLLQRGTAGLAGAVATLLLGNSARTVFAHQNDLCYFPHLCSGCGASSSCPTGYITCTPAQGLGCNPAVCTHTSGWWYVGTSPNRHRCRDCRYQYCPCTCAPNYYGFCGCISTTHY